MTDPTLAELQAVPLAAWRGLILRDDARACDFTEARRWRLSQWEDRGHPHGRWVPTDKGTRYLAALQRVVYGLSEDDRSILKHGWIHPFWTFSTTHRRALGQLWVNPPTQDEDQRNDMGRAAALLLLRERGGEG